MNNSSKRESSSISIGWTCTYFPIEILNAAGIRGVRLIPEHDSEEADYQLDPNLCPYIKKILGCGMDGRYGNISGVIIVNTCDGMRRLYDSWKRYANTSYCYLLDLPRRSDSLSIEYFKNLLNSLIQSLSEHFGIKIESNGLRDAITATNRYRELLNRSINRYIRGSDIKLSRIIKIVTDNEGIEDKIRYLERLLKEEQKCDEPSQDRISIGITGSILDGEHIVEYLEMMDVKVVMLDSCIIGKTFSHIHLGQDPIKALAEDYLKRIPCARMGDIERRIRELIANVVRYRIDGIIYFTQKFCDTYLFELPVLKIRLKEINIPMLCLEGTFSRKISGSVKTRIQAFLEMLGHGL